MADNGKIIRNGAEIQIDENGGIIARPADGQELIVEDDARVGTLEAGSVSTEELIGGFVLADNHSSLDDAISSASGDARSVVLGDATYSLSGPYDLGDVNLIGQGMERTTIELDDNLELTEAGTFISNVEVKLTSEPTRAAIHATGDKCHIKGCRGLTPFDSLDNGIRVDSDRCKIVNCQAIVKNDSRDGLRIEGDENYVAGNDISGSVGDNGSDNYPTPFGDHNNIQPEDQF